MAKKRHSVANSLLEWIAAAVGGLIALALLAIIGREAIDGSNRGPAELAVAARRVVPASGRYVVEVTVRNDGETTAAAVQIEGVLADAEGPAETGRATLDYVPAGGERAAALIFTRDPAGHRLELRATGYAEP